MSMATAPAPQGKRKRQCGPKTRSGCYTCKVRRIKCDEAKPYCKRCTSTGRKCDGYLPEFLDPSNGDTTAIIKCPSSLVPGNTQEKRGFQYFISQTGPEMSGFYSTSFWEKLVLQASAADPALRHAVIAIGSVHEEFANSRLKYEAQQASKGYAFAVSQYAKAIGHLRRSLSAGTQAPITALMSCILFVSFDSLRGHFDSALMHLQSGLKIMRDFIPLSTEDQHLIENHITPLFMRLCVQAILYVDTRSTPARRTFVSELAHATSKRLVIPEAFESVDDARKKLNELANSLFRMTYVFDPMQPMVNQPLEVFDLYAKYMDCSKRWNAAFEQFMGAKSASLSNKELRGAALLKIHHMTTQIMSAMTPDILDPRPVQLSTNDRRRHIKHTEDFRTIVNLCRSLIATEEQDMKNGKPAGTFSSDLGVVGPLYYACIRCQDVTIKTLAIELLAKCPRREGMWDSESGVKMVRGFWETEMKHTSIGEDGVPEMYIPMRDVMEMVFEDDNRWEWKIKTLSAAVSPTPSAASGSSVTTPDDPDWMSLLEGESWLKGSGLLLSDTSSESGFSGMS